MFNLKQELTKDQFDKLEDIAKNYHEEVPKTYEQWEIFRAKIKSNMLKTTAEYAGWKSLLYGINATAQDMADLNAAIQEIYAVYMTDCKRVTDLIKNCVSKF